MIDYIPMHKKILVFSPHPDDEVIGMGATIYKINQRGNLFKIAYLTDGENGVSENMTISKKKELRRREAISSSELLGVKRKDLEFLDLPFYKTRVPDLEDVEIVYDLLTTFMPDIIFLCIDEDPHSTHKKAAEIIDEALVQYEIKTTIYCYKSIWSNFKVNEINFCVGFDEDLMEIKISAIKKHKSQLKNPQLSPKGNPLWLRVKERDESLAKSLRLKHNYAEGFFRAESL